MNTTARFVETFDEGSKTLKVELYSVLKYRPVAVSVLNVGKVVEIGQIFPDFDGVGALGTKLAGHDWTVYQQQLIWELVYSGLQRLGFPVSAHNQLSSPPEDRVWAYTCKDFDSGKWSLRIEFCWIQPTEHVRITAHERHISEGVEIGSFLPTLPGLVELKGALGENGLFDDMRRSEIWVLVQNALSDLGFPVTVGVANFVNPS